MIGRPRNGPVVAERSLLSTLLSLTLLVWVARPGVAQSGSQGLEHDFGVWLTALSQGSLAPLSPGLRNLRWWFDVQARLLEDSDGYDQGLLRPAIGYAFTDEISVWLGYAFVHTDAGGRAQFDEHRFWQQLLWSTKFEPVGFQSRTRLVQRFLETGSDTGWWLRQLFKITYPFTFGPRFGLTGFNELFFNFNDTDWGANAGFAQNRFFAGLFGRLDDRGRATLEIGYLNQFLANDPLSDRMHHIVMVNLLLNLN